MSKGFFVVCEGLDCSGKTTTIKSILEEKNERFCYLKGLKSNTIFGKLSKLFPSTLLLLIEQLYIQKRYIEPYLKEGKFIIQDRWYYSILSHNKKNKKDEILGKLFSRFLLKPHIMIYFFVSLRERIKRLNKKQIKHHKLLADNPKLIKQREKRFLSYYNKFNGAKFKIDTTKISKEKAKEKLYNIIQSNF